MAKTTTKPVQEAKYVQKVTAELIKKELDKLIVASTNGKMSKEDADKLKALIDCYSDEYPKKRELVLDADGKPVQERQPLKEGNKVVKDDNGLTVYHMVYKSHFVDDTSKARKPVLNMKKARAWYNEYVVGWKKKETADETEAEKLAKELAELKKQLNI